MVTKAYEIQIFNSSPVYAVRYSLCGCNRKLPKNWEFLVFIFLVATSGLTSGQHARPYGLKRQCLCSFVTNATGIAVRLIR